jgi:hypothetical protein
MHDKVMQERILWAVGVAFLAVVVSLFIGGIYTITPPNGPVDTAYKINRFTGKVWLVKTYDKQVGQLRVLSAREAAVEPTKEINSDADLPSVAMQQELPASARRR